MARDEKTITNTTILILIPKLLYFSLELEVMQCRIAPISLGGVVRVFRIDWVFRVVGGCLSQQPHTVDP